MAHHLSRYQHQFDLSVAPKKKKNKKLSYLPSRLRAILSCLQADIAWLMQYNHSSYTFEEPGKWPLYESEGTAHPLWFSPEPRFHLLLVPSKQCNMVMLIPKYQISSDPISPYSWDVCIFLFFLGYIIQIIFTFSFVEGLAESLLYKLGMYLSFWRP